MRRKGIALAIAVVVISLIALGLTADVLIDWVWFAAVGYLSVYWTMLGGKILLFVVVFVGSTTLLWVSLSAAPPSGSGKANRTVWESMLSSRYPGLKFTCVPRTFGCRYRTYCCQLS